MVVELALSPLTPLTFEGVEVKGLDGWMGELANEERYGAGRSVGFAGGPAPHCNRESVREGARQ